MARTELPNGVILPAEYSDDWYEDMTSNLTKLDDVIGSDSEKLNSNDVAFLRMSSAALTDGGTGNFSDLNSSNKLKTGDYVLDSGRKLYQIVSVDSTNETFTVGNSLFKVTAESDLAPVAESGNYDDLNNKPDLKPVATSGDYDDLDNKPALKPVATSGDYDDLDNKPDLNPYDQHLANTDIHVTAADKQKWNDNVNQSYVLRYASTSVTPSSTIAYSVLNNTDNIKAGDSVIDASGQVFLIASVDSANQTVTVSAVLLTLALDANVMHLSGNETASGQKSFSDNIFFTTNVYHKYISYESGNIPVNNLVSNIYLADKNNVYLGYLRNVIYTSGKTSTEIRAKNIYKNGVLDPTGSDETSNLSVEVQPDGTRTISWDGLIRNSVVPFTTGINSLGTSTNKWKEINGLTPSSLSLPSDTSIDISGYITDLSGGSNQYRAPDNGFVAIDISNTNRFVLFNNDLGFGDRLTGSNFRRAGMIQVRKNDTVIIQSSGGTLNYAKFIACQGNI